MQAKEKLRGLLIQSAEVRHSGVYSCEAAEDHIEFKVDVAGDLSILSFVRKTNYKFLLGCYTNNTFQWDNVPQSLIAYFYLCISVDI